MRFLPFCCLLALSSLPAADVTYSPRMDSWQYLWSTDQSHDGPYHAGQVVPYELNGMVSNFLIAPNLYGGGITASFTNEVLVAYSPSGANGPFISGGYAGFNNWADQMALGVNFSAPVNRVLLGLVTSREASLPPNDPVSLYFYLQGIEVGSAQVVLTRYDTLGTWNSHTYFAVGATVDFSSVSGFDSMLIVTPSNALEGEGSNTYLEVGAPYGTPVPEPSTYGLALGGLALVGAVIRRRKISK